MQTKTHKSFSTLLHSDPDLCKFVAKIEQLYQVNQIIAKKIDPNLANHCQVANLRDGILILTSTSPAWNHKLRFSSGDLLSELRAEPRWAGLKGIELKVDYMPQFSDKSSNQLPRVKTISRASAEILTQTADNISNTGLAAALKRLSGLGE